MRRPITERFWRFVLKTGGCWLWQGSRNPKGYGQISRTRAEGPALAHRISWELAYGEPPALCVLHRCDNPRCVRPDHLFLGTLKDNNRDMLEKGRARGRYSGRISCLRGHALTGDNLYMYKGTRGCKECRRETVRARRRSGGRLHENARARELYAERKHTPDEISDGTHDPALEAKAVAA